MAGNNPFLSKQQFYTAMRLVSAAQVWHGLLHHTASFTWSSILFTVSSAVINKHSTVSPSTERRRKAIRSRGAVHPHRPGSGVAATNDGGPGGPEDRSAADSATGAVTCAVSHARLLSLAAFPLGAQTSPGKLPTWQASDLHALAAA